MTARLDGRGQTAKVGQVVPLADPGATEPAVVGGKAAMLSGLARAGFAVPDAVIVTTAACARITAEGGQISGDLQNEIAAAIVGLGGGPLAVRSSGVDEDQPAASYAGQYLSVLGVPASLPAVCGAIGEVVRSARAGRVEAYRARIDAAAPAGIAVLVQRQVDADAAGVAFTADPITGDRDRTLVSAVRGLGDQLVSGAVTPEEWAVREGVATRGARAPGGDVLTAAQATEIAALARRVEARAGAPSDIEWAIADGVPHLLQARPITALPTAPTVDLPAGSWVKESGRRGAPITPFGASVALPLVADGLATAFAEGGGLLERIEMRGVGGEVYLRIVPVGGPRASSGPPPPWWLLGILARVAPPLRARCRAARHAARPGAVDALVSRWTARWRPRIVDATERLRALDVTAMSDAALDAHLAEAIDLLGEGLAMHFRLVPPYALTVHELVSTCRELLGWDAETALELLAGTSQATSEPARELAAVAALVTDRAAAREALAAPGGDVVERLAAVDEQAGQAFAAWRDLFGLRVLGEDPGAPTLAEQPATLAGLLRDALEGGRSTELDVARRRDRAISRARTALAARGATERDRFEAALAAATRVYPTREDSAVWAACRPAGLVRGAVVEIGRRLAAAGALDRADDVVLLDIDTVRAALGGLAAGGPAAHGLRAVVARARAERAWVAAHPGPRRHGPPPSRPPDLRGLPEAARRMNEAFAWTQAQQLTAPVPAAADGTLRGAPGSPGRHTGSVRIVRGFADFDRIRPGDVVACVATDPSWSVLFATIGAIVTEGGGALSHTAIIAREHGIPAVLAVEAVTQTLRDGQLVTVDGAAGTVTPTLSEGEQ